MKRLILLITISCITANFGYSQVLYVPSGTGGIGTSTVAGKVGIGISAPAEVLHINGNIRGNQTGGALRIQTQYGYIDIGSKNASFAHFYTDRPLYLFDKEVRVNGMIGSYSGALILGAAGTQQLSISTDGVSTFSGTVKLPYDKWLIVGYGNSINSRFEIQSSNLYKHSYINFKKNLYFRAADQQWICPLVLQYDGSVGIGFETPYDENANQTQGYKLAVNGSVLCDNISVGTTNPQGYKIAVSGGILCDNIGIGTTNLQGYKFAINGGMICEEVKVITDVPSSDYVFNSDYKLLNLPNLEKYIKENKHLPEVSSAKEFKENGYKVGEMDNLLLKKVEELTLYIIELNKKIETLEKRLNKREIREKVIL